MDQRATYEELALHIESLKHKIEEGRQARDKLEHLLRRYKGIFDHGLNARAVLRAEKGGRQFRFLDFNRAAERIDQIRKEEVLHRLLLDVLPNMDDFGLLARLQRVYKTGRPEYVKAGFYKDSRIQGWREYYIYKLSIKELVTEYRDTTHLVNAHAAMRQSVSKYQELYQLLKLMADNVPDAIWAKDMKNQFLFVNQAMCDKVLHCRDIQEALGKTDRHFAQRQRDWGYRNTFGELGADSDEVTKERKKSGRFLEDGLVRGRYLALDVHKAPFFDKEGGMIGTVGSGRDITREKKMERALKESEERFSTFMGHFPGMVFLCNESLCLTYVNPYMREVLGEQAQVGRSLNDLFYKEAPKGHALACLQALTNGVQESNQSLVDCHGNVRIYRLLKFPIYRTGESIILGGIGIDITSLVEAKEALRWAHGGKGAGKK